MIEIRPQEGRQEEFLSTPSDIAIYGGAKGGGKTFALLLDPLRYSDVKGFNGTIFRRTKEQIRNSGALWDSAYEIYGLLKAVMKETTLEIFYNHLKLKFSHLEYEKDKYNWDGAQICYLAFDELQHFSESQFWYLVGSNRSTCGVKPYVRGTCMPDPDSWVKKLIAWWLNEETGYAIKERSGTIRYLIRLADNIIWGDSFEELKGKYPKENPLSITFIYSDIYDNKILLESNPGYLSNLKALNQVERERKLKGNWNIRPHAGMYFKREWFEIVDRPPLKKISCVRFWDRAATAPSNENKDPDWTSGVKMCRDHEGYYYVEHASRFRESPFGMRQNIRNIAELDGKSVQIGLEQEPGASGKVEVEDMIRILSGFVVKSFKPTKDKVTRSLPFSSQCEAKNVKLVRGKWNEDFLTELENFDGNPKKHDDQVDSGSGAFEMLQNSAPLLTGNYGQPKDSQENFYMEKHESII